MKNNDLIRITPINNEILYNLEDAARLLRFKGVKSALQILPKDLVYQLTVRNGAIFDMLWFITIEGLELLIRRSKYAFTFTDKDMSIKVVTPEMPPYSFLDRIVKVIPTTAVV